MNKTRKILLSVLSALIAISAIFAVFACASYDGPVNQGKSHKDEKSMYLYTFDIELYNPCNSDDMDDDAVNTLYFRFDYKDNNGYGAAKSYTFDLSWNDDRDRNNNSEILKKCFIRGNDNSCFTQMQVWVPGIISNVHILLNMDGGERLGFTVKGIYLNGFKVNTDVDYVSSAYYDSEADIPCYVPKAAIICPNGVISTADDIRDQYDALFTDSNITAAGNAVESGDCSMIYHYNY